MKRVQEMRPLAKWLVKKQRSTMWLAQQVGVSYPTAWAWIKGMAWPKLGNAKKLAKLTGLSLEELTE